jgi:hypothetical protein
VKLPARFEYSGALVAGSFASMNAAVAAADSQMVSGARLDARIDVCHASPKCGFSGSSTPPASTWWTLPPLSVYPARSAAIALASSSRAYASPRSPVKRSKKERSARRMSCIEMSAPPNTLW